MPIVELNSTRQLEFGQGDINVGAGLLKSDDILGVVCFSEQLPRPIGSPGEFERFQEVDLEKTPVRMVFEKVESIDVIIKALEDAKRYMIQGNLNEE